MSRTTSLQRAGAWAVHFYTATGTVAALAAVLEVIDRNYRAAFLWLAAATFVDATDGVLARLARVKTRLPGFDGARLDDIVDYLTYVFVPVLLLVHAGTLPRGWGVAVAAVVLLSSAYGFASTDAKSDDYFFTGFPSYWNIAAVYVYAARLAPLVNALVLLALSALIFVRVGYVYPTRTPVMRRLTLVLGAVWALMVLAMIAAMPDVPAPLLIASMYFPVYYTVLSFALDRRRPRS